MSVQQHVLCSHINHSKISPASKRCERVLWIYKRLTRMCQRYKYDVTTEQYKWSLVGWKIISSAVYGLCPRYICKCMLVKHLPSWQGNDGTYRGFCVLVQAGHALPWMHLRYVNSVWQESFDPQREKKRRRPLWIHNLALTDRWYWQLNAEGGCF